MKRQSDDFHTTEDPPLKKIKKNPDILHTATPIPTQTPSATSSGPNSSLGGSASAIPTMVPLQVPVPGMGVPLGGQGAMPFFPTGGFPFFQINPTISEEQKLKNVFNKVVQESEQKNLLTDSGLSIQQSLYELNPKWCTPIISIDSPLNCTEIPSQISLEEFEWPSPNLAETSQNFAKVIEENGRLVCSECHKCLLSWQMYQRKRHLKIHHKFECQGCDWRFVRKVDLQKHIEENFTCRSANASSLKSTKETRSTKKKMPGKKVEVKTSKRKHSSKKGNNNLLITKTKELKQQKKDENKSKMKAATPPKIMGPLKDGQVRCPYCSRVCTDQDQCFRHLRTCEFAKNERNKS